MDITLQVRRNVVIGAGIAGLLVLGSLLLALNVASGDLHWNDMPWSNSAPIDPNSAFAEGKALHCSGIEKMAPAAALTALEGLGFQVKVIHDRAASSRNVMRIPHGSVLQDVGANDTTAFMFVMTPEHPRFAEGFFGSIPPQNC